MGGGGPSDPSDPGICMAAASEAAAAVMSSNDAPGEAPPVAAANISANNVDGN